MILSDKAKNQISTRAINRIALELDCSAYTVSRWLKDNEPNNDLTKAKSVQIISEETGIPEEDVLVDETVTVPQN